MTSASSTPSGRPKARWSAAGVIGLSVLALWLLVAIAGSGLAPLDPGTMDDAGVFEAAGRLHWLGTDYLGRDLFSRLIVGTRYTVGVALLATFLACSLGTTLALLAAVSLPWMDGLLSRLMDTLISIPSKMFALVMVAAFGSSLPLLILTAAIVYTPGAYRIARSLAVNINAMDYVLVARARGEGNLYVMRYEILPNIAGPVLADMGLRFVYVVLLLASMSFLGLGVQPPQADWGSLVRENIGGLSTGEWAVIAPAIAIASLTLAVNMVIDNLPGAAARAVEAH